MSAKKRVLPVKTRTVRAVVKVLAVIAIVIGLGFHTGWGTISSAGIGFVASMCPLGALEGLLGAKAVVVRLVLGLVAALLIIFLLGRAFCAWICPIPPLSAFFRRAGTVRSQHDACERAGERAYRNYQARKEGTTAAPVDETKVAVDSRHLVLCGALGSAAIFGFPVFCLVCPIGLTCAFIVLLMRLLGVGELSWGLLVFPVVVVLELTLLREYCAKICPIAALMSLVGRLNRTFRPKADQTRCMRSTEGTACHACASACPLHIDPHSNLGEVSLDECTRCKRCADACPRDAISFPLLAPKD